ncbi:bacteriohemerythrin [Insolitispirillum peregrinum]|uniref:Hemerythrin n=1 Tax=Insolitispirillum peregrinum TaxID=80876 RepID=A0A1N7IPQ0_9PROT|nr:bacteriohemerythrin [Insolitispirillum peregrinum]SIS38961.1 hemerythrin [Insolitispirillum peregrinum]
MPYFVWQDSYTVGHPTLDYDHQRLGQIINRLDDAVHFQHGDTEISAILSALRHYVESHFAREERLLEAAGYHHCTTHSVSHRRIEQTLEDFENLHRSSPDNLDAKALLAFLQRWLINHILKDDMDYRPMMECYLASRPAMADHPGRL